MTTRATARETTRATVGREVSLHGRAPRSARSVAAGYRTFRRRCRLSARQKKVASLPNLRQFIFCRLLNGSACCSRQARCYRHFTCRRRLPLAARSTFLGSRDCSTHFGRTTAVADNTLIIKQKSTLPVSKTRQDKSLFRSLSGAYLPPVERTSVCRPRRQREHRTFVKQCPRPSGS